MAERRKGGVGPKRAPGDAHPVRSRSRLASAVDRASPVPLWAQVYDDLRRGILAGAYKAGFPTDSELVAHYGVSRPTVREAVRRLVAEGLVERERGRGSRVRPQPLVQPLGFLYSLFRVIEAQGVVQTSVVRRLEERRDPAVAAELGLPARAPLLFLERLRLAGEDPLALDQAWLPAALARPLLEADFSHTALYDELAARCGVEPEEGREEIRPVVPDPATRGVLGLGRGEAALLIERRTWARGAPLELRRSVVRGDRTALVAEWPRHGAAEAGRLRLLPRADEAAPAGRRLPR
ncbi:GntR family transcriptional regulator [Aciditerrimonas ferrireducens]|jgi:GntR family transcriptional regulator|uniref:GntR family transcriptional regulator n=1 Tax=Aciditerrimonas ferrireducens TaxID=667306 RepID=UPI002003760F|nr:GntR family transcriptional regulator [Aciditerrimonas ferrireducens]MCK4176732.1 GntR family transcriptional regulator [Aciditerrimonas ferrireducens]